MRFSNDGVVEARGLVSDQQVIAMHICKQRIVGKRVCCGHTVSHCSFYNKIFFPLCWGERLQGWKVSANGGVHDAEFTKKQ